MDSLDKKVLSQKKLPEESLSQEMLTKPRTSAGDENAESGVQAGQDFAALISMERSVRWPTAKKFWTEKKDQLNCSYNRYAVIEKGSARSGLDLARKIIAALGIDESAALHAWVRDLMPDESCRNYFAGPELAKSFAQTPVMPMDRGRLELFTDHEFSFEMAVYIFMYTKRGVFEEELSQVFRVSRAEVRRLLALLLQRAVIVKNSDGSYEVRDEAWLQIPDFKELRPLNNRLYQGILESHVSTAYYEDLSMEIWCMRLLNQKQISMIRGKLMSLMKWIGMLPDEPDSVPYGFTGAGNLAQFGKSRKKIFREERELGGNYFE